MVELSESLIIQPHCCSFEKDFHKDRDSLIASILEYGNPFEEEKQNLVHITSKHVLDDVATKSVKEAS